MTERDKPVAWPTVEEWAARAHAARERAIAKGYTPEHDAEHGVRHLLNWAIDYARRGRAEDASGLILSAIALLDAPQPVTKEQEWEYGRGYVDGLGKAFVLDGITAWRPGAEADVERARGQGDYYSVLVRRRKAGPWEPVEAAREEER